MKKPNIIITGAEGRIGKIIIESLSDEYNFFGIDKAASSGDNYLFKIADISEAEKLEAVFREIIEALGDIQAVVHLAADGRLDAPWESVFRNNIVGTKNVYECARKFDIPRVIFASTNHTTGSYEKNGFPENMISVSDPIRPDSDYAVSKAFGEVLAREYHELCNINSICLRIGSVLEDDDPTKSLRTMRTWLSHRDLTQLFQKSLESSVKFGIYYGVSVNDERFWNIANAEKELGYKPADNAALCLKKKI
jgi:nucleoside-diphosphate-sugar epimerase